MSLLTIVRILLLIPSYLLVFFAYVFGNYAYMGIKNPTKDMVDPDAVLVTIMVSALAALLAAVALALGLFQRYPTLFAKIVGHMLAVIPFGLAVYRLWRVLPLRQ